MTDSERERSLYLQNKLRARGIRLEDFLQEGYEAIVIHSCSTILTANQALADLVGYSLHALEGMNAWNLFPPRSAPIVAEKLKQQSEEPYQVYVRRKDGNEVMMELKGINFDIGGEPARAILVRALGPI